MSWPIVLALLQLVVDGQTDDFVLGYLTGSRRRPGDIGYSKPGRMISGAISLATEEINAGPFKDKGIEILSITSYQSFVLDIINIRLRILFLCFKSQRKMISK